MSDRWVSDMIGAINRAGSKGGGNTFQFRTATVQKAKPLTIRLYDQNITKNLYVHPACIFEADDNADKVEQVFSGAPEPQHLFSFLRDFHKRFVIRKGDQVLVLQVGAAFYVLEKMVKA